MAKADRTIISLGHLPVNRCVYVCVCMMMSFDAAARHATDETSPDDVTNCANELRLFVAKAKITHRIVRI